MRMILMFVFYMQVAIETIYTAIQTFVYCVLLYSMIGFEWTAPKFFYFYYFIFMCFTYFSMYGMMVVALTPGYQIAAIVMSFFLSFWNLFSGFLVPRPVSIVTALSIMFLFFIAPRKARKMLKSPRAQMMFHNKLFAHDVN